MSYTFDKIVNLSFDEAINKITEELKKGRQQLDKLQLRGKVFMRMYGSDFTAADRERIIKKIPNIQLDAYS